MDESYIKLFRKFKKWEWYDDINTKVLFLHLLLSVNYEDKRWHGNEVKKGQMITSLNHLVKETKLTKQQVRTSLSKLKSTQEITYQTTHAYTLITLLNWGKYQCCNEKVTQEITHQSTHEQHTSNTPITLTKEINKEINNIKEKNIIKKEKYGEYKNVLLTENELQSLKSDYDNYQDLIKYLDEYIEMKGYKAKSHYLCIKKWVVDAVKKQKKGEWWNE